MTAKPIKPRPEADDDDDRITPGHFYGRDDAGRLHDLGTAPQGAPPDAVVCRRVADFPGGVAPRGSAVRACVRCGAMVAFNPEKFPTRPRICMQCSGIAPEAIPDCTCRTRACGHRASEHTTGGVCMICRVACWS